LAKEISSREIVNKEIVSKEIISKEVINHDEESSGAGLERAAVGDAIGDGGQ
jgi:uncharacterized membrane protein